MQIAQTRAPADVDAAAQIWAEATAARDGEDEVAELADSRPIIQAVLDRSPESMLFLARLSNGLPLAFAAVEPGRDQDRKVAELSYIGVSPHLFGHGLARELLTEIRSLLTARGYDRAELSVYTDNHHAIRVYEHLGWRPFGDPTPHVRT